MTAGSLSAGEREMGGIDFTQAYMTLVHQQGRIERLARVACQACKSKQ